MLLLVALAVLVGLGTAVPLTSRRVTATPKGTDSLYLPMIVKPGTPPPQIAGCDIFPDDHIWNTPIDDLPVHANSANYINTIGASQGLHADFGSGVWPPGSNSPIGIPYIDVPGGQPLVPLTFV